MPLSLRYFYIYLNYLHIPNRELDRSISYLDPTFRSDLHIYHYYFCLLHTIWVDAASGPAALHLREIRARSKKMSENGGGVRQKTLQGSGSTTGYRKI